MGLVFSTVVILAVMAIFFFLRQILVRGIQRQTTSEKEVAAYLTAHAVGFAIQSNILSAVASILHQAGFGSNLLIASMVMNALLTVIVLLLFIALRWLLGRSDVNWLVSLASGRNTIFKVRQRRLDRFLKLSYLLAGLAACVYFIVCLLRADWGVALLPFGIIALFLAVAAVVGLFPALWGLKEQGISTFVVSDRGIILAHRNGGKETIAWSNVEGPYYSVAGQYQRSGTSAVHVGAGVSGYAYVGAHAVSNAASESVLMGINLVRSGTVGRVFVKHKGMRVDLACLLSADEAEYLCNKVADATALSTS